MKNDEIKIGLIGLDTSHCEAFTQVFNDSSYAHHIPGARVVVACPGVSTDYPPSVQRSVCYIDKLKNSYKIPMVETPEEVASQCDLVMITSLDGRKHLEFVEKVAPFKKPTFVDKPFTTTSSDAERIVKLSKEGGFPLMSCSALRYMDGFRKGLETQEHGALKGMHVFGTMILDDFMPGWFFYGVHWVEMVVAAFGPDFKDIVVQSDEDQDHLLARWKTGAFATINGQRTAHRNWGVTFHFEKYFINVDLQKDSRLIYCGMLEKVIQELAHGKMPVSYEEMLAVVRMMEVANKSRQNGQRIFL